MSAESGSNENPTRTEEERIAYIQRQIDHAPSFPTIPREDMDFLLGVIGKQAEKVRAAKRALDRWNEHSFADPDSVYGPLWQTRKALETINAINWSEVYEDGKCPDCYELIGNKPDGGACDNCEHVFWKEVKSDES